MNDLILIGDEAWTPEEWEREQKRRARTRVRSRETYRLWAARNIEKVREMKRDHMRRKRGVVVGSLHDLACTGTTRATGCVCKKIRCYDRPRRAA